MVVDVMAQVTAVKHYLLLVLGVVNGNFPHIRVKRPENSSSVNCPVSLKSLN